MVAPSLCRLAKTQPWQGFLKRLFQPGGTHYPILRKIPKKRVELLIIFLATHRKGGYLTLHRCLIHLSSSRYPQHWWVLDQPTGSSSLVLATHRTGGYQTMSHPERSAVPVLATHLQMGNRGARAPDSPTFKFSLPTAQVGT